MEHNFYESVESLSCSSSDTSEDVNSQTARDFYQ